MGNDMETVLRSRPPFPEHQAAGIVRSVLLALNYLHKRGIVHACLNPQNILFKSAASHAPSQSDGSGGGGCRPPLAYLNSFSKCVDLTQVSKSTKHPSHNLAQYAAPESSTGSLTDKVDIWALGIVAYEALSKTRPYDSYSNDPHEISTKISKG